MRGLREGFWRRGLAELVVIVAGVLIALWIEGLRQASTDRSTERSYLERLEADLVADSARLAYRRGGEMRNAEAARLATRFVDDGWAPTRDTLEVLKAFHFAGFLNFLRLQRTTWDDLVATGNLKLLRDQTLRQALGLYYESQALHFIEQLNDHRRQAMWERYTPAVHRYTDALFMNALTTLEGDPGVLPRTDFDGLRRDRTVREGLLAAQQSIEIYLRQQASIEEANHGLLVQVRAARGS